MPKENDGGGVADPVRDFGYDRVPFDEHRQRVRRVFETVSNRYDLMNDLMSGGLHRFWKSALLDRLNLRPEMRLIDVAGGTGDIALGALERMMSGPKNAVVVCDINPAMLRQSVDRSLDRGIATGIERVAADAEALPYSDMSVDACTIAFGLRNVTHRDRALAEMHRILKPGGHFLCLEFSPNVLPLLSAAYDIYSFRVIPALGGAVTGDRDAYLYLVESIRRFPSQQGLIEEMTGVGFENVTVLSLTGGIVALHSGWRL